MAYLGFSAETGELSDNFDIISVETKNMYTTVASSEAKVDTSSSGKSKGRPKARKAGGGWGWFFVKIVLVGVAIGGGYVGWTMYKTSKQHSRFD